MLRTVLRVASRARGTRGVATAKLPDLPYDFGALQPVISGEIMQARACSDCARCAHFVLTWHCVRSALQLHHGKHHAAYVANFNAALAQYAEAEAKGDVGRMIALQPAIKFNGGGAALRTGALSPSSGVRTVARLTRSCQAT